MKRPAPFSARHGFTLLEIILATAVAAIVLIAIQTVFFGALRLRNTTTAQIARGQIVDRTFNLIATDLNGLMIPGGTMSGTFQSTPSTTFNDESIGQRISPDFYTTSGKIDGWTSYSEVQIVTYYLAAAQDGSGNKDLIRAVTRNVLPAQEATVDTQTLIGGIADATFEFYEGSDWTDTWDSTQTPTGLNSLPTAVRFRITYPAINGQAPREPLETVIPILPTSVVLQTSSATQLGLATP